MAVADPTPAGKTRRPWRVLGAGAMAVGACAVCCAGPVLAVLGGLSIASFAGAVWVPGLALVAVLALIGVVWVLRKRRRTSCAADSGPVDLGMPAPSARASESDHLPVDTF
ncbi:hypothetical protein [Kribbella sp. CA-294648]|uniref:hypothetical protein n=1 Tax=Kribbella sp. CA-294648 TaxID=3239948 RepID=UPI003D9168EC